MQVILSPQDQCCNILCMKKVLRMIKSWTQGYLALVQLLYFIIRGRKLLQK